MAFEIATGYVSIVPSMAGFSQKLSAQVSQAAGVAGDQAGKSYKSGMLSHVKSIAAGLAGAFVATKGLQFFKDSISQASALNESINAVNVTFGKSAKGIQALSNEAANSVGLSKNEFNGLAVQFSNFVKTVAGSKGDVVGTMDDLTTRAADFASVMDLEVNEAATLFQSGLAGETEPLRKYGIDLSAAAVEAHALAKGIFNGTGEMTEAQKVQARYSLLMEQTSKTAGDFANTSDSLANRQRRASAEWKNAQAAIGTALLPVMEALTGFIQTRVIPAVQAFGDWFTRDGMPALTRFGGVLRDTVLPVLSGVVGWLARNKDVLLPIAGIIGAMVLAYKTWAFVSGIVTTAQIALNFALSANPIGIVVMAIAGLVAALVLLWNKNEGFRNFVIGAWNAIKDAAMTVWNAIKGVIQVVWDAISWYVTTYINVVKTVISTAWDWIKTITSTVWDSISWYVTTYIDVVKTVITTAWDIIKGATQIAWDAIKTFIINPIQSAWQTIQTVVGNVREWLSTTWGTIRERASTAWQNVKDAIVNPISNLWNRLADFLGEGGTVRTNLAAAWNAIKGKAGEVWGDIKGAITTPISELWGAFKNLLGLKEDGGYTDGGVIGKLVGVWDSVVTGITSAFSGVKKKIATPFKEAFDWVNTHVIDPINTNILDKFGAKNLPHLPSIDVDKMATGGWVRGKGTGTSDDNLRWLSNGEFVVNARAANRNKSLLEQINNGQPITSGATQGTVPQRGAGAGFNPAGWLKGLWDKGAGGAIRALTGPAMDALRKKIGGTFAGDFALGALDNLFSAFAKVGDKLQMAPTALMEALFQYMKGIEDHSGYLNECLATIHAALDALAGRFGYTTGSMISSYPHPNAIISALGAGAFNTTDPPRGALTFWRFARYGHIAVATGKGNETINNWGRDIIETVSNIGVPGYVGWLPPEKFVSKFDSGGYLQPGWNATYNGTGRPEPVLTSQQWDALTGGPRVVNNWQVEATTLPTEEATMAAWRRWEALQAV